MFYWVYPLIALLVLFIGNDNPIVHQLSIPSFYTDLLLAFGCTYLTGIYFRWLFRWLDKRYPWVQGFIPRLPAQLLLGLFLPVSSVIGMELLYLRFGLGMKLRESPIFYLELPLVVLFCILVQLIYFQLYARVNYRSVAERTAIAPSAMTKSEKPVDVIVHSGVSSRVVKDREISYFLIEDKLTYLHLITGERHLYDQPMERVVATVDLQGFYQVNRQLLVHRRAVRGYERTTTRRLELLLYPPAESPQYVPKTKAVDFINWLAC